jgi:hypothetical protein
MAAMAAVAGISRHASFAATPDAPSADSSRSAGDFERAVARLDKIDARSPFAQTARLDYADYLAQGTEGDCEQRLRQAQALLDAVAGNALAEIVLPLGRARAATIEYRIHVARWSCGDNGATTREAELRAATAAAQRAVDLYRDALDYQSMVIMQFDVAVTLRRLGDSEARAALEAAIEMDREFGFSEDAQDNDDLLRRWNGATGSTDHAAGVMESVPNRKATLKFDWRAGDSSVALNADYVGMFDGKLTHGHGRRTLNRRVDSDHGGWVVSYPPGSGQIAYDVDAWPDQLAGVTESMIRGHAPGSGVASGLPPSVMRALHVTWDPFVIEEGAAESHALETAAWIGATLEQGVWYDMAAVLELPGVPQESLIHDIEFAYTHPVSCGVLGTDRACIEIVVHATPRLERFETWAAGSAGSFPNHPGERSVRYWSTTYMRLVVDPNTLMPYARDERRYWYVSVGNSAKDSAEGESERIVLTYEYP